MNRVTNRVLFAASALLVTVHVGVLAHAAGEAPAKEELAGPSRAVTADIIDAVADKKVVHKNAAARNKSRLAAAVKAMG